MIIKFERKDRISKLVDDKYIEFFSNSKSEYFVWREGGESYNDLVGDFLGDLYDALDVGGSDWQEMKEKYLCNEEQVTLKEMIKHLEEFDIDECLEYLWFCCIYESRFIAGVVAMYGKISLIHPVLIKIKQLLGIEEL